MPRKVPIAGILHTRLQFRRNRIRVEPGERKTKSGLLGGLDDEGIINSRV
jgi:hypothetical protein